MEFILDYQISTTDQPYPLVDSKNPIYEDLKINKDRSMFSLQPSDELVFGTQTPASEDLMTIDHANFTRTSFINFGPRASNTDERESSTRVVHRDVERKRRKKMSNLYHTLNSLIPTEFKKGKRGICDQMQDAENYIKTLQNKIQHLRIRRDRLSRDEHHRVTINLLPPDAMEILITSLNSGISPALQVLGAESQLDVVNCLSTQTNQGFLHKIHIQGRVIDVSVLHDKLSNAMK